MTLEEATENIRTNVGDESGLDADLKFDFGDEGTIFIAAKRSPNTVDNSDGDADCTVRMSFEHFQAMLSGDLNPMMAFMSGKIKIDGDMGVAMKLQTVLS